MIYNCKLCQEKVLEAMIAYKGLLSVTRSHVTLCNQINLIEIITLNYINISFWSIWNPTTVYKIFILGIIDIILLCTKTFL